MVWRIDKQYKHAQRYKEITEILIKNGLGYLLDRFNLHPYQKLKRVIRRKKIVPSTDEAERLRKSLEELGPTFIKFGQMLSTRYDILPSNYITELSKLQDEVPSFDYQIVNRELQEELQAPPEQIYKHIEEKPLAAASIGQVHRATLKTGEEVIIKIKRPGIENIINTDLEILLSLAHFAEKYIPEIRRYNPVGFIEEFSRTLRNECDYIKEARTAEAFKKNFKDQQEIIIPTIYRKYTTRSILTMEYIKGTKITETARLRKNNINLKQIAEKLSNAYFRQIFENQYYHADPHPGNILVTGDGNIAFLDFGIAGRLDREILNNISSLLIALIQHDINKYIEILVEMEFLDEDRVNTSLRFEILDLIDTYYSTSIKHIDTTELLEDLISLLTRYDGRIPANIMLLSKTLSLLEEIGRKLDPDYNFAELAEPYIKKLIKQKTQPKTIAKNTMETLVQTAGTLHKAPSRIDKILKRIERGTLKIEFEDTGIREVTTELGASANRLAVSIIISALIIGSSMFIQKDLQPQIYGVTLIGVVGFLIAGVLAFGLAINILQSGKI
ncbi:MAG: AarF/ABC1/UbiB kinase family protein [Methanosarcinales archaeon]|uniref:AarF/ABC1/UbiB kinase family protein n=1 Tax=Candidatus Ethanoperedens thermophilum TaxID=2766897 RepID=A0A848D7Y3_9EURY|nr:AarF/ABC1/UbiB kinase family protein [Candidatus Ethanoperedens thermophilum]